MTLDSRSVSTRKTRRTTDASGVSVRRWPQLLGRWPKDIFGRCTHCGAKQQRISLFLLSKPRPPAFTKLTKLKVQVLVAAGDGAIMAGPVGATAPTLDGGEWHVPKAKLVSERKSSPCE